jgi:hypothetical protein
MRMPVPLLLVDGDRHGNDKWIHKGPRVQDMFMIKLLRFKFQYSEEFLLFRIKLC